MSRSAINAAYTIFHRAFRYVEKTTKLGLCVFAISICLVFTALLPPSQGAGLREHVYYFGFPWPFFSYMSYDFFAQLDNAVAVPWFVRFSFDVIQFAVNIASIFVCLLALRWLLVALSRKLFTAQNNR